MVLREKQRKVKKGKEKKRVKKKKMSMKENRLQVFGCSERPRNRAV